MTARRPALLLALLLVTLLAALALLGAPLAPAHAQDGPSPIVPDGLVEIGRGSRTLDEIAATFPAPEEARALMIGWGWQRNAYFDYAGETAAGTTSLEVSFHLFGSPAGATEAMSYFAAGRALVLGIDPIPIQRVGDQLPAIGGPRDVGNEVTLYLRNGAFLIRISAVAPAGDPQPDALATARALVQQPDGVTLISASTLGRLLPVTDELPPGFVVSDEGSRSAQTIADTFLRPAEAAELLSDLGFQRNLYRNFTRDAADRTDPGGATSIEVSLHLFSGPASAAQALVYYAEGRREAIGIEVIGTFAIGDDAVVMQGPAPGGVGTETTVYLRVGNALARISAVSPDGDPTADALATAFTVAERALLV